MSHPPFSPGKGTLKIFAVFFFCFLFGTESILAQSKIDPSRITIARDNFGVPHIYAPTDPEVAYGLAWSNAEDDFEHMQWNLLSVLGRLGEVRGTKGAIVDIAAFMIDVKTLVEEHYESDLSADYRALLEAYAQGVNDYAEAHPEEILLKDVFPIRAQEIVMGYSMGMFGMTNVEIELLKVFEGTIVQYEDQLGAKGSNGMAFRAEMLDDGLTTLISNSHQPVEGSFAWYEAHLISDEGWNMLGATFPGGATMFLGTNENLGWTHTLNYPDYTDVYKLTMHPDDKLSYLFDGEYRQLVERPFKFKVKLAGIKIPIKRTFYWSVYGPTLKTKEGFYSLRFPANMTIGSGEQWYRMNKARNFDEFLDALSMQRIAGINVIYADKDDNIYYLANGHFPERDPAYDWTQVLPGNTSATLWPPEFDPIDSLVWYKNPDCNYLFNTNNSPFFATCEKENLDPSNYDPTKGYLLWNNNRAWRFHELIREKSQYSYDEIREIKYDTKWKDPAETFLISNLKRVFEMPPEEFPRIKDALEILQSWNHETDIDNYGAALWSLCIYYTVDYMIEEGRILFPNELTDDEFEDILAKASKHLRRKFGTLDVPLGVLQRHVRGKKDWPVAGTADVLAAMNVGEWKNGLMENRVADSYIMFARYNEDGVQHIESINPFGASTKKDSPHFEDQVPYYLEQRTKPMTLDWQKILKEAEEVYHPGEQRKTSK
jgi:acyl-homoserine-lactone acylase